LSAKLATFELEVASFASILAFFSSSCDKTCDKAGDKTCDKAGDKLGTNWGHCHFYRQHYRHYLLHSLRIIPIHDGSKESSETTAISSGTGSGIQPQNSWTSQAAKPSAGTAIQ